MSTSFSPLYKQIAKKIKDEINKNNLKEGDAIPSESKLAEKFNVSRVTIRQAINMLVNEGLLYKIHGSGTYIKKIKLEHNIYNLVTFTEEAKRYNKNPINKILEFKVIKADDKLQNILNLSSEDQVFFISRLRCIDDIPLILEKTYLPVKLFPDLSYDIMLSSKYKYIEKKKNLKIKESHQEIIPIIPDKDTTKLLNLEENTPILYIVMHSILESGIVFEYTELYFKSDEYKFSLVAKR
ncbi:GntR family transcriptional regulator [Clostridium botulinum]|nr:GntR family transcriptional regulator [Clostridium botulinum]